MVNWSVCTIVEGCKVMVVWSVCTIIEECKVMVNWSVCTTGDFRSGHWLGHSRTLICFFLSHSFVALAICFGSLSCHVMSTDPECCGTPDFQRSQIYTHHPAAHWPPLAACYSSHQIQDIGARIPGNQGISPRLHPTAHQTLHTGQTSTLRYLWTSGTPRPSHLHCSFTTALCSGPTMVEWPSCGRQNSRDVVHVQTQTENPPLQTASLPPSLISS